MTRTIQIHGGNIDLARQIHGSGDWIDLSTGINRRPYPLPPIPAEAWTTLPTRADSGGLHAAAAAAFGSRASILALAGAQAAIQLLPRLMPTGTARILGPTYHEYATVLRAAGWLVEEVHSLGQLAGAELAVVVNPNNPDGRHHAAAKLLALVGAVGLLVVDESFADPHPELSLAPLAGDDGLLVLRSFGKFYGLAGLRLGFVLGSERLINALSDMAGPWPISGVAIHVGKLALADNAWSAATLARLGEEVPRLDALAAQAGWPLVGGTALFRLYHTPDAGNAQAQLARHHIWSRRFATSDHWPNSDHWLRLGLPGTEAEWHRLAAALAS